MKKIKYSLDEIESCFIALSYMFSHIDARKEYKNLLLDYKIEYPTSELDIISNILIKNTEDDELLINYDIVKELIQIKRFSDILDHSENVISEIYYKAFIEKITGNRDALNESVSIIEYEDNKQAFLSYIGGNFKALINSDNEYKFIRWNGKVWTKLTDEESRIIYNNFIEKCEEELLKASNVLEKADYTKIHKRVKSWDSKNKVNEALDKVKRSSSYIINLNQHEKHENIICSKNGMIIDLNTGNIKASCRNDLILNTSKYNLVDRELSEKYMTEILEVYKNVLGDERLNFLLDLIAYKMLGKNLQKAVFMIGAGATGKSTFKNIIKDLFEDNISNIPYEYFTINHRGNEDKSRDDLLVSLNNKLFGVSSEGEENYIISQAKFKTILSNSTETARPTRGNLIEVNLQKLDLLIDTNSIPKFGNFDDAVNRRLLFIRFINKIPLEKRNANFYREEIKPNFDYVFSFFIYRSIDYINNDFNIPQCIIDDTCQNVKEMDSLLKLSTEYITPIDGFTIDCEELEELYIKLCNDEDFENIIPDNIRGTPKGYNFLINRLKDYKGYENITRKRVSNGRYAKKYVIEGITFLDSEMQQEIFNK